MFNVQMQQSGIPRFLDFPALLVAGGAVAEAAIGNASALIFLNAFVLDSRVRRSPQMNSKD
jgi:hypothetical protein